MSFLKSEYFEIFQFTVFFFRIMLVTLYAINVDVASNISALIALKFSLSQYIIIAEKRKRDHGVEK